MYFEFKTKEMNINVHIEKAEFYYSAAEVKQKTDWKQGKGHGVKTAQERMRMAGSKVNEPSKDLVSEDLVSNDKSKDPAEKKKNEYRYQRYTCYAKAAFSYLGTILIKHQKLHMQESPSIFEQVTMKSQGVEEYLEEFRKILENYGHDLDKFYRRIDGNEKLQKRAYERFRKKDFGEKEGDMKCAMEFLDLIIDDCSGEIAKLFEFSYWEKGSDVPEDERGITGVYSDKKRRICVRYVNHKFKYFDRCYFGGRDHV